MINPGTTGGQDILVRIGRWKQCFSASKKNNKTKEKITDELFYVEKIASGDIETGAIAIGGNGGGQIYTKERQELQKVAK